MDPILLTFSYDNSVEKLSLTQCRFLVLQPIENYLSIALATHFFQKYFFLIAVDLICSTKLFLICKNWVLCF